MFEDQTFKNIMERMLEGVPGDVDKREGSIIYDALAPAAAELRTVYLALDEILSEFFIGSASMGYLRLHGENFGLEPKEATAAVIIGEFSPETIDVGGQFFSVERVNYTATERLEDAPEGKSRWLLTCHTTGESGNIASGKLLPITEIPGLATAEIVGIAVPGDEAEGSESFRQRLLDYIQNPAYGGNVADYLNTVGEMDGVGLVRVSPCTDDKYIEAGGHVLIEILDADYAPASPELCARIETELTGGGESGMGYGLAPIGHKVHVKPPMTASIDIEAEVKALDTITNFEEPLQMALSPYFEELRERWSVNLHREEMSVSVVKILYEILDLDGVEAVTSLKINGEYVLTTGRVLTAEFPVGGWALPVIGKITRLEATP
ncbi:MAG: baseplate J/gp47 family protein [Oscillospiraceae bacterium]|nr:baseplate J/gp47 family protein [Oscillospiraceae bacterium]